ncbi:aldo/keto reductase [Microvirga lotononidis]|uniref:Aldo/keto reductase, diketogulonate reductase n=1 Tax=Microvirga lotononidis TaxID=864069 RepID=I4YVY1_9HYPH|nr:aldo/keto reductase [Microvirga lotononidis]EIM28123.1 aldo/keto reductase, diketogulonate reductase [Microvirga lotononidis]WQO27772.1 aldo/keto reductase [Microvirga lotononidis]
MGLEVMLPGGEAVPALGQGTWHMAESASHRAREIDALRLGVELGMTLIDTAEMYGEGAAEQLVAEALAGQRDRLFLVSKVYPHNASCQGVMQACERSLGRLKTDRLDLYLLHWRGSVPLEETVAGFEELRRAGKIRHWGVSNFDTADMEELFAIPEGANCATNQVLYNVSRRGPEFDLIPWMQDHRMPLMAYSPIEQGRLPRRSILDRVGQKHGASPFQIALAWVLDRRGVIAIPKASSADHVRDNHQALEIQLDRDDVEAIDAEFPPPRRKRPLEMI